MILFIIGLLIVNIKFYERILGIYKLKEMKWT